MNEELQVNSAAPPPEVILGDDERLAIDLHCRHCGYNLRGLRLDTVCPECQTPVERSARGDLLRFADPDWVQRVATGCRWLVAYVVLMILWGCTSGLLSTSAAVETFLVIAAEVVVAAIGFVGYWMCTMPDPSQVTVEKQLSARRLARVGAIASLLSVLVESPSSLFAAPAELGIALNIVAVGLGLLAVTGFFALLVYAIQLAYRIPDPKLAGRARLVMWGLGISYALMVIGAGLIAVVTLTGPGPGGGGAAGLMFVGVFAMVGIGIAILIFSILAIFLLIRFSGALADQAALARQLWNRPGLA